MFFPIENSYIFKRNFSEVRCAEKVYFVAAFSVENAQNGGQEEYDKQSRYYRRAGDKERYFLYNQVA